MALGQRDHFWRAAYRMLKVNLKQREADKVLLDDSASQPSLSPDGSKILFVREGERWWRKGYRGERAGQIWQLDLASGQTTELLHEGVECLWRSGCLTPLASTLPKVTTWASTFGPTSFPKKKTSQPNRRASPGLTTIQLSNHVWPATVPCSYSVTCLICIPGVPVQVAPRRRSTSPSHPM